MRDEPELRKTRRRSTTVLVCFALITHHSSLTTASAAQPLIGEPQEHFYRAKGQGIRVRWEVEPKAVHVGGELVATLVITGAQNPGEVVKPNLGKLSPFGVFKITAAADPPRDPATKDVRFAYRLAPRNADVTQVPALRFYYFNPAAAPGKTQFPLTTAASVPLTVREAPKPERVVTPLDAPEFLFQPATGPDGIGTPPFVPCRWAWLAAALFGPLAALGWFLAWRRVFPDAARLARLRRSRAARRATDAIRKAGRTPDPPAAVVNAVLGYLRGRFPLSESATTPSEIAAALREFDVPADAAEQAADVFRACDRARFAPSGDNGVSLEAAAEALVARLEALA